MKIQNGHGLRTYFIEKKQIGKIVFHNGEVELLERNSGWLENANTNSVYSGDTDITVLNVDMASVRNARKVNLSKKDHFTVSYFCNNARQTKIALYLYSPGAKQVDTLTDMSSDNLTVYSCDVWETGISGVTRNGGHVDNIKIKINYQTKETAKGRVFEQMANKLNEVLSRRSNKFSKNDAQRLFENGFLNIKE